MEPWEEDILAKVQATPQVLTNALMLWSMVDDGLLKVEVTEKGKQMVSDADLLDWIERNNNLG